MHSPRPTPLYRTTAACPPGLLFALPQSGSLQADSPPDTGTEQPVVLDGAPTEYMTQGPKAILCHHATLSEISPHVSSKLSKPHPRSSTALPHFPSITELASREILAEHCPAWLLILDESFQKQSLKCHPLQVGASMGKRSGMTKNFILPYCRGMHKSTCMCTHVLSLVHSHRFTGT